MDYNIHHISTCINNNVIILNYIYKLNASKITASILSSGNRGAGQATGLFLYYIHYVCHSCNIHRIIATHDGYTDTSTFATSIQCRKVLGGDACCYWVILFLFFFNTHFVALCCCTAASLKLSLASSSMRCDVLFHTIYIRFDSSLYACVLL